MPRESPHVIVLTRTERHALEKRAREYTLPYRDVVRAKIVLMAADGLENKEIAERLSLSRAKVSQWRKRFCHERLGGLEDRPRPGRPRSFSPYGSV